MTGVRCYLDVDQEELARALAPLGPMELCGPPRRQVSCELWRVEDGRVLVGGRERHEWALFARELGGMMGGVWGASLSWAYGALSGAADPRRRPGPAGALLGMATTSVGEAIRSARHGAREGSARAGEFLAQQAVALTRWTVIEPYNEVLLSVPDVRYRGMKHHVSVVLGMLTDQPLAIQIDRMAFYGYDKHMAGFDTDARYRWDVSVGGAPFLSARLEPTGRVEGDFDRARAATGTIQPLLGGLRDRRPMLAELRRDLVATGDQVHEVEGTVELSRELFPGLRPGRHTIRSRTAPADRVSVGFRGVDASVSYPRPAPG
jgi:hypothetical protein